MTTIVIDVTDALLNQISDSAQERGEENGQFVLYAVRQALSQSGALVGKFESDISTADVSTDASDRQEGYSAICGDIHLLAKPQSVEESILAILAPMWLEQETYPERFQPVLGSDKQE